jgi:hypothetical protein
MISDEMLSRTFVTPEALVGALAGAADADFLSAQLWPLDLALAALEEGAPADGALRCALARMPQSSVRNGVRFTTLRMTIHALTRRRLLMPGGSGWEAGYRVAPELVSEGRLLSASLDDAERRALRTAGYALLAATKMA